MIFLDCRCVAKVSLIAIPEYKKIHAAMKMMMLMTTTTMMVVMMSTMVMVMTIMMMMITTAKPKQLTLKHHTPINICIYIYICT